MISSPSSKEESLAFFWDHSAIQHQEFWFLQGQAFADGSVQVQQRVLQFHDLEDVFLGAQRVKETQASRINILITPSPKAKYGRQGNQVVIPRKTLDQIVHRWKLHHFTLEGLLQNNGAYAEFGAESTHYIIIKVANSSSVGYDYMSLYHDCETKSTNILFHGVGNVQALVDTLTSGKDAWTNPRFFVFALYIRHQRLIEHHRKAVDDIILRTEATTGFGKPGDLLAFEKQSKTVATDELDSKSFVKLLSFCHTELDCLQQLTTFNYEWGRWTLKGYKDCRNQCKTRHTCALNEPIPQAVEEAEYFLNRALNAKNQVKMLYGRVLSQTKCVNGLIAQDEAEYARAIALDSKRDSAAMKIIAVMTTLFLPGTFVAGIFAMNMIQWDGNNDAVVPQVSKLMWVYWVITIPLTLIVFLAWVYWTRKEYHKSQVRLKTNLS